MSIWEYSVSQLHERDFSLHIRENSFCSKEVHSAWIMLTLTVTFLSKHTILKMVFLTLKSRWSADGSASDDAFCVEKDINAGGVSSSSAATWTNWAVSGMTSLTSKIYRGNREAAQRPAKTPGASTKAEKEGSTVLFLFRIYTYTLKPDVV